MLELSATGRGWLHFVDLGTAERFARFLLAEGAAAVAIEHWRDGRPAGLSLINPPPAAGHAGGPSQLDN